MVEHPRPVAVGERAQLGGDLRTDVVEQRERRPVREPVPHLPALMTAFDDAVVVEQREVARDVLLGGAEGVGECLDSHLAFEIELLDDPDAQRLAEHRETVRHTLDERIGDRMLDLHRLCRGLPLKRFPQIGSFQTPPRSRTARPELRGAAIPPAHFGRKSGEKAPRRLGDR